MTVGSIWRLERRVLDDDARLQAPGRFVRLGRGSTHYEMGGPQDARAVLLIHGFSVPSLVWDPTYKFLAEGGLRVVRYDLFGRGYSDRPDVSYGMPLYVEQARQLLDALGLQQVDLIGLSMGGAIAAAVCASFPERVRRLVLIAPSGARPAGLSMLDRLAGLPGMSSVLFSILGNEHILEAIAEDVFDAKLVGRFRERYRRQMEYLGFRRAIVSTIRAGMLGSFESVYAQIGLLEKQILVIWGEADKTVPFAQNRRLLCLLPKAEFLPVSNCGHVPHVERPDITNPRLLEFLN